MRISKSPDMAGAEWELLAQSRPWELACEVDGTCRVFGQFRGSAGTESPIIYDETELNEPEPETKDPFLPLIEQLREIEQNRPDKVADTAAAVDLARGSLRLSGV